MSNPLDLPTNGVIHAVEPSSGRALHLYLREGRGSEDLRHQP